MSTRLPTVAGHADQNVFTFTWSIENFSMCPQKKGECIKSPSFVVDMLDGTWWRLLLYPKGDESTSGNFVSCRLSKTAKKKEPEEVTIDFGIALVSLEVQFSITHQMDSATFGKDSHWGFRDIVSLKTLFDKKSEFLPSDSLTLQCHMRRTNDEILSIGVTTRETFRFTAPSLESNTSVISDMESDLSPVQCFYGTRIPVERRRISWIVKNFSSKVGTKKRVPVSVPSKLRDKSELLLTCYVSGDWDSDGAVKIIIQRKDKNFKQTFVRCKTSVLDKRGDALLTRQREHLFRQDFGVWIFPVVPLSMLQSSNVLHDDKLSLSCQFFISYKGEEVTVRGNSLHITDSMDSCSLGTKLIQLLQDNRNLTDIFLRAGEAEARVHKTVICAHSPVFQAMFHGDTQEKSSGIISITELDAKTLMFLRDFMYEYRDLHFPPSDAMKLYQVAVKYQMGKLKEFCVSSLKYGLSQSNVYEVLIHAWVNQNSEMIEYVVDFMCLHSKEVFCSPKWDKLKKDNIKLASETMHNVLKKMVNCYC